MIILGPISPTSVRLSNGSNGIIQSHLSLTRMNQSWLTL